MTSSSERATAHVRWQTEVTAETDSLLSSLARSDGPIVVGPWHSEVGFELLYWVPFLRWATRTYALDPSRLVAVSRGGVSSWYAGIADRYLDIFDVLDAEEFRRLTEERWEQTGGQKQTVLGPWDERILDAFGPALDWAPERLLHPLTMYNLFRRFWKGGVPIRHVLDRVDLARFEKPDDPRLVASLPERYVAVRFYFRPSFPDTADNRRLAHDVISALARSVDVVLLNTGLVVDDHEDFAPDVGASIHRPLLGGKSAENLHAQSVVISRAQSFVGTYGGLSYLGPCYGVPSFAFYSQSEHFFPSHLDVARRLEATTGAPLVLLDDARVALAGALRAAAPRTRAAAGS